MQDPVQKVRLADAITGAVTQGERRSFSHVVENGCELSGDVTRGPDGAPTLVMLHGWTSNSSAFDWCISRLSGAFNVVRYDQRFHGKSSCPEWGRRVPRLAADLDSIVRELVLSGTCPIILIGCSLGAAVIFCYGELFGLSSVVGAVVVDQAPLQYRKPDWSIGSLGMRDDSDFVVQCRDFRADSAAFAAGLVEACTGARPLPAGVADALRSVTAGSATEAMLALMDDHTRSDWRAGILHGVWATTPLLAVAGSASKIFPVEGSLWAANNVPLGTSVVFDGSGHWPHIDAPDAFADAVIAFGAEVGRR